jgi:hypothetical protein
MKSTMLALTLALGTFSATAATSAQLFLKGLVPVKLDLAIVQTQGSLDGFDLTKALTNEKVATVTETSNSVSGYKIRSKSLNNGRLINASDSNSSVPYTLTYNNLAVNLNQNYTDIGNSSSTQKGSVSKDIKMSYTVVNNLVSGTYQDTVEFEIIAN